MLASVLVEERLRVQEVSPGRPGVGSAPGHELVAEVLRRDPAVLERQLELGSCLVVRARRALERVAHGGGKPPGQRVGRSSGDPAYASAGLEVSISTPAPRASAVAFTG